ncbi:hypothetical protein [Arthrobacter oryzae]|nr:hypothetical protein [Arthrobacter oryzae]
MPELNRSVIANIESRRRKTVTLEEALTLAFVLDVSLVHLIVPIEEDPKFDAERYLVTPENMFPIDQARAWIKGGFPLSGQDPRMYFSEVPKEEFQPSMPTAEQIASSSADVQYFREVTAMFGFNDKTGEADGVDPEKA